MRKSSEPQYPYELFGIECGKGWEGLYRPIMDYIDEYNKTSGDNVEIHQIKEKFGGLRMYLSHYTDELRKMIREAEEKSFHTCEICGKHIDNPIVEHHWIYSECQECHDKWISERKKSMENNNKENEMISENCKD